MTANTSKIASTSSPIQRRQLPTRGSLLWVPVAMGFSKFQSHLSNLDKLEFWTPARPLVPLLFLTQIACARLRASRHDLAIMRYRHFCLPQSSSAKMDPQSGARPFHSCRMISSSWEIVAKKKPNCAWLVNCAACIARRSQLRAMSFSTALTCAFGSRCAISRHSAARSLHSLEVTIGYSPNPTHQSTTRTIVLLVLVQPPGPSGRLVGWAR